MEKIRIEDDFEDVIGKAMAGLTLSAADLAEKSGLEPAEVDSLLAGQLSVAALRAVAPILGLSADALENLAEQAWYPPAVLPDWVALFNTPFPVPGYAEMTVNSYLFWSGPEAIAVDTGADASPLLSEVAQRGLRLKALLLTHTHRDHVAALGAIRAAYPETPVYCPEGEAIPDTVLLKEGARLTCGALEIEARLTAGHSPGALSYCLSERGADTLAFVGDAIFCLSMGKAADAYEQALRQNREKLLSLPETTLLCPGHGPITTVGDEQRRNPFYAA
ncbi:MAG: MBL fold metallo-hydrolase [Verrucomicrobia bacterium]|jgi:glyoxylase-like metal-dependent hydrolase (beta-lactamase superfamily II)|nr:MBL fold metallo-hydrolase [Verrucomicrobiota bacterium]